jgi:hypothetical protein
MKLNSLIASHQQKIEELQKQMVDDFNALIKDEAKSFFEKYPEVRAIAWTQYTPYFNDGDPCEFSVGDPHIILYEEEDNEELEDISPYDGHSAYAIKSIVKDTQEQREKNGVGWITPVFYQHFIEFTQFTKNVDLMERVFGDHATVYLTRDGSTVCEYNHD